MNYKCKQGTHPDGALFLFWEYSHEAVSIFNAEKYESVGLLHPNQRLMGDKTNCFEGVFTLFSGEIDCQGAPGSKQVLGVQFLPGTRDQGTNG